jgi:hypothetical protein
MPVQAPLMVHFFARLASADEWPRCWKIGAFFSLEASRIAAHLAIETTFPTVDRFEIVNADGEVLYAWPDGMPGPTAICG